MKATVEVKDVPVPAPGVKRPPMGTVELWRHKVSGSICVVGHYYMVAVEGSYTGDSWNTPKTVDESVWEHAYVSVTIKPEE